MQELAVYTIGGRNYRSGKMDAFTQLHVVRRLAPLIAKLDVLGDVFSHFAAQDLATKEGEAPSLPDPGKVLASAQPMIEAFGLMPDKDVEYVLNACLDVTMIEQGRRADGGTVWSRVRSNGVMMYDYIDLPVMMQIAWQVLKDNLMGFSVALGVSNAPPQG